MSAPVLVDPTEAFLARDPTQLVDPHTFTPETWQRIGQPVHSYRTIEEVALGLGAAFLVLRTLITKELDLGYPTITTGAYSLAQGALVPMVKRAGNRYRAAWSGLANPALQHAMTMGAVQTLTTEEQQAYATLYSHQIFDYINDTSAQTLVKAFENQLSQKWHPDVAWMRSVAGYGLEERSMTQYLKMLTEGKGGEVLPHVARTFVQKQLEQRAKRIGFNEAYRAQEMGKTLTWLTQYNRGELPADTQRQWVTAEDERVCKICGPMDTQKVPMQTKFTLPDGNEVWAPGVHPNCRCQVKIAYPEMALVAKAYTREEHQQAIEGQPREHGRFATRADEDTLPATSTIPMQASTLPRAAALPMTQAGIPAAQTAVPVSSTLPMTQAALPKGLVATPSVIMRGLHSLATPKLKPEVKPQLATEHKVNEPVSRRLHPHGSYYAFANDLERGGWQTTAGEEKIFRPGEKVIISHPQAASPRMLRAFPLTSERSVMFQATDAYADKVLYEDWDSSAVGKQEHHSNAQAMYAQARARADTIINNRLQEPELKKIYRYAGVPWHADEDHRMEIYEDVMHVGEKESSPLSDAYYHYLETEGMRHIGGTVQENLLSTQRAQEELGLVPHDVQVFIFERGMVGNYTPGSGGWGRAVHNNALIQGQYRVSHIRKTPLKVLHSMDAPSNVDTMSYVYLEPVDDND